MEESTNQSKLQIQLHTFDLNAVNLIDRNILDESTRKDFEDFLNLMLIFTQGVFDRDKNKIDTFFKFFDDYIYKIYAQDLEHDTAKFLCLVRFALKKCWDNNPVEWLSTPAPQRPDLLSDYYNYRSYLFYNAPFYNLYPDKYRSRMDQYPIDLNNLGLSMARRQMIVYWLNIISFYPESIFMFFPSEQTQVQIIVPDFSGVIPDRPNPIKPVDENLSSVVYEQSILVAASVKYLKEFDAANGVAYFTQRLDHLFTMFKGVLDQVQVDDIKTAVLKNRGSTIQRNTANDKTYSLATLIFDTVISYENYKAYTDTVGGRGQEQSEDFENAFNFYKTFFGKLIEDAKKRAIEKRTKANDLTDEKSLQKRYDFKVGRKDSWVSTNMRRMFKPGSEVIFRSPQDTVRATFTESSLRKPLVYLLGSSYENIWRQQDSGPSSWLSWKSIFNVVLQPNCIVFPVSPSTGPASNYDEFCNQIALQSADVIIAFIDGFHRNIEVIVQTLSLIILGYPVILICEDITVGKFPESDVKLNDARDLVRHFAAKREVPVFDSFTSFTKRYASSGGKNRNKQISVDMLLEDAGRLSGKRQSRLTKKNTHALATVIDNPKEYKNIGQKSIMYSKRPIFRRVMVDVDKKLVESDKSFTFSILNSLNIDEYYSLLLFAYFNKLGIIDGNIKISPRADDRFRTDFQEMKGTVPEGSTRPPLEIDFLDTTFYKFPEFYEDETLQALSLPITDTPKLRSLSHYVEIQVALYFLYRSTRHVPTSSTSSPEDYLNAIRNDPEQRAAFENLVDTNNVFDLSPIEMMNLFISKYVVRIFEDVNLSRLKLKEMLSLYPEVLNLYVPESVLHLAKFYRIPSSDVNLSITIPDTNETIQFGDTDNYYLYHLILQSYWNRTRAAIGLPPEQILKE